MDSRLTEGPDEYVDDDDAGFDVIETDEKDFVTVCEKISKKHDFPQ